MPVAKKCIKQRSQLGSQFCCLRSPNIRVLDFSRAPLCHRLTEAWKGNGLHAEEDKSLRLACFITDHCVRSLQQASIDPSSGSASRPNCLQLGSKLFKVHCLSNIYFGDWALNIRAFMEYTQTYPNNGRHLTNKFSNPWRFGICCLITRYLGFLFVVL